jgi:A/G-specific adenine glycosylase
MPANPSLPPAMRDAALAWFDANGRTFAIRQARDPYAVLVSEVMAQQTQIGRAQEYWTRWMQAFPSVEALAAASPADVLRAWAGLGYNRRAINLQRAARVIVAEHGGRMPDTVEVLEGLPGVGPYTARAVAAIAFGRPVTAIDTNVRRVLSRVASRDGVVAPRRLQALADCLVPRDRPGAWTQALMDVGATFCRSRRPDCEACPVRTWCRYSAGGGSSAAARGTPPPPASPRFVLTTRWLRGRILERLRRVDDDAWTAFVDPIGEHRRGAVVIALAAMARDGLVEIHRADPARARLPLS